MFYIFIFYKDQFIYISFITYAFGVLPKNHLPNHDLLLNPMSYLVSILVF
jgi:hypothetical protein